MYPWEFLSIVPAWSLTTASSFSNLSDDTSQDPFSEERFHVELHFSPGVKGVEEEGSAPTGYGFRPASSEVGHNAAFGGWGIQHPSGVKPGNSTRKYKGSVGNWRPLASLFVPIEQNEEMKADQGSMENLCPAKAPDETDRALQTSPQPPEGHGIPRRSPLIRNRKAGSMEVMGRCRRK